MNMHTENLIQYRTNYTEIEVGRDEGSKHYVILRRTHTKGEFMKSNHLQTTMVGTIHQFNHAFNSGVNRISISEDTEVTAQKAIRMEVMRRLWELDQENNHG